MLTTIKKSRDAADLVVLGDARRQSVRGQNFFIDWATLPADAPIEFGAVDETMVLLPDVGARIFGTTSAEAPSRSLVILPAGIYQVLLTGAGRICILSTSPDDRMPVPENESSYAERDQRVSPVGPAWQRTGKADAVQVFAIDRVKPPPDNPRLKMFQSATMSINWVDYDGPRDRKALSPHAHHDFEQASVALAGNFVHHLRVEWGKNADEWREDQHLAASKSSVLVVPPGLIHTTEGIGPGHHLLIDVFAPPRRDFIAKKWILNSHEYADPSV